MTPVQSSTLIGLTAVVLSICAASSGRCEVQAAETRWIAQYDLGPSLVEPEQITITLRLRLLNPGTEALQGLELRIEDSLLVGEPVATFDDLTIPPRGTLDLERRVALPPREHELWIRGGRPKLYLVTTDADGFPQPQRVELSRERLDAAPVVSGGDSPGPVNLQQAPPADEERP